MELNFGIVSESAADRKVAPGGPFRLAILGDFSAHANAGRLDTGDALAKRKPLRVDVDTIDKVIQRLGIKIALPLAGEGAVEFAVAEMDDFHPDRIYEKVDLFSEMSDLRQRIASKSGFASASKELVAWRSEPSPLPGRAKAHRPRGATVPRGGKLSDFAKLIGQPSAPPDAAEVAVEDLLRAVVRPYIVKAKDPAQPVLLAAVDKALAATMRKVLHHPDFQTLESLWRSVDMLTRRIETSTQLQIVLYDISAEELAADLSSQDALEETGLFKLLVEQPALDAGQGALSAMVGAYVFDQTPPQAELLGRVAKIAARASAPFIASIDPDFLKTAPEDVHPLIKTAWEALRGLEEARYLGLVVPRFLLRQPYGDRTDPIDSFEFEEFTPQTGLKGMLWANPAFAAGVLLAQTFAKQGAKMNIGSILTLGDIPYYFYVDEEGDQTALPCTERLVSERLSVRIKGEHFIPLLSIKGRPEVRLAGFTSLAGSPLAGRWPEPTGAVFTAKVAEPEEEEAPEGEEAAEGEEGSSDDSASESGGDSELDSLMSSLDDSSSESGGEEASTDAASDDAPAEDAGEGEMDPELAELLKGL